jgi:FMN-dependent NADH-azoreductase
MLHDAFHAHVYFQTSDEEEAALVLRDAVAARFPSAVLGRVHDAPVAFHPAPMFQVALHGVDHGTLLAWLDRHRRGLSVLVHPLTGDVVEEHTTAATWLGRPLPLDLDGVRRSPPADVPVAAPAGRTVLRVDASARREGSVGRALADTLVDGLGADTVLARDLASGVPLLDHELVAAFQTAEADRTDAQRALLEASERLVRELEQADAVVLTVPIYNFGVPASFKAWIDLVARARRTFRYSPTGPVGLLADRPVYVVITSGGTRLGSSADFVSGWLRHVLGFLGLKDVHVVEADGLMIDRDAALARAHAQIAAITARRAA